MSEGVSDHGEASSLQGLCPRTLGRRRAVSSPGWDVGPLGTAATAFVPSHSDPGPSVGQLETLLLCTAPQSTREGLGVAVVPLERGRGMVPSIPSIPRP